MTPNPEPDPRYPAGFPYGAPAGPPPAPPAPPAPPTPPVPPTPRSRQTLRGRITLAIIALALAVVGVLAWKEAHSNPDAAKVGDCVSHAGGNDIKIVDCTDSKAAYKVVGKVENQTEPAFQLSSGRICKPFPAAKSAFWKGEVNKSGYVLCLGPVK